MQEICKAEVCTGCEACRNVCPVQCISLQRSDEGFNYPVISQEKCIDCGLCARICPVNTLPHLERKENPGVYAAWSLDMNVRCRSSSGGVFSEFAAYFLQQGGYVCGAAFDEKMRLRHVLSDTQNGVAGMRGSKYLQSEIGSVYREVGEKLKNGFPVFFTGTPCQVAGLYAYLQGKYTEHLLTADLVCHGVPSPGLFDNYFQQLQKRYDGLILGFIFRKLEAWDVVPSLKFSEGWQELHGCNNIYQKAFLKSYLHRESCYRCPFARIPRVGDITMADFWGIGRHIPFHYKTTHGVSLLLVNSCRGEAVLSEIGGRLFLKARTLDEAKEHNGQLVYPDYRPTARDTIYRDFSYLSWEDLEEKYGLKTPRMTLYRRIRRLGGEVLRKLNLRN